MVRLTPSFTLLLLAIPFLASASPITHSARAVTAAAKIPQGASVAAFDPDDNKLLAFDGKGKVLGALPKGKNEFRPPTAEDGQTGGSSSSPVNSASKPSQTASLTKGSSSASGTSSEVRPSQTSSLTHGGLSASGNSSVIKPTQTPSLTKLAPSASGVKPSQTSSPDKSKPVKQRSPPNPTVDDVPHGTSLLAFDAENDKLLAFSGNGNLLGARASGGTAFRPPIEEDHISASASGVSSVFSRSHTGSANFTTPLTATQRKRDIGTCATLSASEMQTRGSLEMV